MSNVYNLTGISPSTLSCAEIRPVTSCNGMRYTGLPFRICGQTQNDTPDAVTNLIAPDNLIGSRSFSLIWDRPQNFNTTPGVLFNVTIMNRVITLTDATYLYISNLDPCTVYGVEVGAYTLESTTTATSTTSVTTKSTLSPPENLEFVKDTPGTLRLTWNHTDCANINITSFRIYWRCNNFTNQTEISSLLRSMIIDVSNSVIGFGWCVAQSQSCDNLRCGNFSTQAVTSLPQQAPSPPICFMQAETSSNISFSFTLSQPFITDNLNVVWMLNSTNMIFTDSFAFGISNSNVVNVGVASNTPYTFRLQICNIYGCSVPCDIDFTTKVSVI